MSDETPDPSRVEAMRIAGQERWDMWSQVAARPAQLPHESKQTSLYIGGRASGKSKGGGEWLAHRICTEPGSYGLLTPTVDHGVTECLEENLYTMIPPEFRHWRGSVNQVDFANGSRLRLYHAREQGKVRGPNLMGCWIDEPAEMRYGMDAWTNAQLATRIERPNGLPPQIFVTGTPKRVPLMQHLLSQAQDHPDTHHLTHGTMRENIANLSAAVVEELTSMYEGTNLGMQELDGIMVEDVEGALLTHADIQAYRVDQPSVSPAMRVMSIDPGFSNSPTADEVGMIIGQRIGTGNKAIGEVIDDCSTRGTPGVWGDRVVDKVVEHQIDVIVWESNLVGQFLKETLAEAFKRRGIKIPRLESVVSRSSKWTRAEPVAALAQKGRYRMVGTYGKLEAELTTWVPDSGVRSPNRLDAWAQLGRFLLIKNTTAGKLGSAPTRRIPSIG